MERIKVGTIEVLQTRLYPLDVRAAEKHHRSWVIVEPGHYDLFQDGLAVYWSMSGRLSKRGVWAEGDGLLFVQDGDEPSNVEVTFPSRRLGPNDWVDLLAGPEFEEGSPAQRVRVHLTETGQKVMYEWATSR